MHLRACIAYVCVAGLGAAIPVRAAQPADPLPVSSVDLRSYLGKWYEIARLPRFYQRYCVGDSIALYSIRDEHTINVENSCRTKDGDIRTAHGTARPVPGSNNAKLEVTFLPPFTGDYWILGLAPDYSWSVVGSPGRKSLWILSRTPRLSPADLDQARSIARTQGYPVDKLIYTPQSDAKSGAQ
ncbi:lipocalin family protein [Bordetella sp. H567]|uniref:lipocalin family protein n=1 Tax=Bordetella sp. H567 TaxID=1697043 RepID=UPI00082CBB3C|nr:lipocalin family protein [Bordetella sp. H567]